VKTNTLFLGLLASIVAVGCASSTLAPRIDAPRAAKVVVGLSQTDVERIMGTVGKSYSTALRPDETFEAWAFDEGQDSKCLFITYDKSKRVIEAAILLRDRGRNAMPLPSGC
jgi:hypothetical protein